MKTTAQTVGSLMFVEWFIWGARFVPTNGYGFTNKAGFPPVEIGWSYACVPPLRRSTVADSGRSVTDRFFSAQKVTAVLMFCEGAVLMYFAAQQTTFARLLSAASGLFIDLYADHR